MTEQSSNIHALLIGIDHYEPNQLFPNLKGSVRDIELVETFLTRNLEIPQERIQKLISRNREDETLMAIRSAIRPEPHKPTYDNIVSAFNSITETAQPGEQVYIHYSGHGGRAATVFPKLKQGTGTQYDEGLVPMDIGDSEQGRYLRDVEMTTLLKRMTDKGLIVTVVLDSCHSGGATRGMDAQIRSGIDPDLKPRTADSLVASREELEENWLNLTRTQGMGAAGLPKARDYVLLAACRPNESAYEYSVNGGGERNGALTYWMIDTLTSVATSGQPLTYKLLHDRLSAQIQSKFPQQLPMIMGESNRRVFGSDIWTTPYTIVVQEVDLDNQVITLGAGQAQGLSKGARFAIYPHGTADFTDLEQRVAIAEIFKKPEADKSKARLLSPEEGGVSVNGTIELGAPAVMVSAPVELIQRVRLFDGKEIGETDDHDTLSQLNQLPPNLVDRQTEALEKVRQALQGNGWVVEAQGDEAAMYQVAIDSKGNYEICRGMPIPNLRPSLSIVDVSAPQEVLKRLVHLTKYQAVQSLDNVSSKLSKNLTVELLTEDGEPFPDPQNPEVEDGDIVTLRLKNNGTQPLRVAVLDLEPTWEISQIPLGGFESPFLQIPLGAEEEMQLQMGLPDDPAYQESVEILKVFAIQNGLADFRWLTLPALDEPSVARGTAFNDELRGQTTRGLSDSGINPLNDLLTMIGADMENAPTNTRSATLVRSPKDEWITQQIQIVVKS